MVKNLRLVEFSSSYSYISGDFRKEAKFFPRIKPKLRSKNS